MTEDSRSMPHPAERFGSSPAAERRAGRMDTGAQRPTAHQLAYEFLRDRILSGHYKPGVRLRAEHIAAEIGVSRMPVREAVLQLDAEGLLTTLPNRGVVVSRLTPEEVVELFEIRAPLEGLATRLAVEHATEEALLDLDHCLARMRLAEGDHLLWIDRHDELHDRICRLSHRDRLCQLARQLRMQIQPYLRLFTSAHHSPELTGFGHDVILAALRARDADRAEAAMREHVMANAQEIASFVREEQRLEGRIAGGRGARRARRFE
ncbi:MAG: GntR family transcriptional regulator [Geminicoccaceae bacterium]|nr:MAG: GntR family transcriptional regulator [Geminicoccaceae bacterium]